MTPEDAWHRRTYWRAVRARAKQLRSDGCSFPATQAFQDCCCEHDIGYRTGRDLFGNQTTKAQDDERFKRCMQYNSRLGRFSLVAWVRYQIVRRFAQRSADRVELED